MKFGFELELICPNYNGNTTLHDSGYFNHDQAEFVAGYLQDVFPYIDEVLVSSDCTSLSYDTWNIVPDLSLKPSDDSLCIELVSPVMPCQIGKTALTNMLGLLPSLGFVTNNTTGLHLNLSPSANKQIDYLFLISSLNELDILKAFGRLNNSNCYPITKQLDELVCNGYTPQQAIEYIVDTNHHGLSVHIKPTHVEFRHIGGDYLNNEHTIQTLDWMIDCFEKSSK